MQPLTPWRTLEEAKHQALQCTGCRLSQGRTQVVWMDGSPDSNLMFIGEAPGFHEDKQGKPFVGAAGKLLDELLAEIGLDRTRCAICNVLKCRPPGNRNPLPEEIESCHPYLDAQIRYIDPKVIVTLGNFATKYILKSQESISKVRGREFNVRGFTVLPTFHPAAVLHSGGSQSSPAMRAMRSDFQTVSRILKEAEAEAIAQPPSPAAGMLAGQDSLF